MLEARCEEIGALENLRISYGAPGEYMASEVKYDLLVHTCIFKTEMPAERAKELVAKRLSLLGRKLVEDLEEAEKIFVYSDASGRDVERMRGLVSALRRFGPNVLLWVVNSDGAHEPGLVKDLGGGLLRGYVGQLVNPAEHEAGWAKLDLPAWRRICRNARALVSS